MPQSKWRLILSGTLILSACVLTAYFSTRKSAEPAAPPVSQEFLDHLPVDLAKREQELRKALAKNMYDPKIHHEIGNIHAKRGRLQAAAGAYQRELKLDPKSAPGYLNLGNVYFMGADKDPRELEAAVFCYQKSLELDPNSVEAHYNLALAYRAVKKDMEALLQLDAVLALDPKNPQAKALKKQLQQGKP